MAKAKAGGGGYALKMDATTIGESGLNNYGGFIREEFLTALVGAKGAKTFNEMAQNDAVCGAVLFAITMLIRQVGWTAQEADESDEAHEAADFLDGLIHDMDVPFASVIEEVCSMFTYGFAPMEIVWKIRGGPDETDKARRSRFDDNRMGIRKLALRGQTTVHKWEFDEDEDVTGLHQQTLTKGMIFLPIDKLLLFKTQSIKANPEGRSVLRSAYRGWYFKKRIEEVEGVGIERDLVGLPVVRIPAAFMSPDADPTDKAVFAAYKLLVKNVRRDSQEGLILPSDKDAKGNPLFDFELMTTGGTRQIDTSKIIERKNREMATAVLADFIFLGQGSVGSFALSSDKTALFATAVGGFVKSIADVFNMDMIPRIWQANGLDPETMPTLVPEDIETPNLGELGSFITALAGAGMPLFPDRDLENALRKAGSLPPAPEDGDSGVMPTPVQAVGPTISANSKAEALAAAQAAAKAEGGGKAPGKGQKRQAGGGAPRRGKAKG